MMTTKSPPFSNVDDIRLRFYKIGDDLMMLMFYEGLFYLVRDMITL